MITRRDLLKMLAAVGVGSTALSSYAVAESFGEWVTPYALTPPGWTPGLRVRLAVLADLHVCEPWMSVDRVAAIVDQTNSLKPDAILLLGDYVVGRSLRRLSTSVVSAGTWATALGRLKAPLGVHAVLGNHDWWDDPNVQKRRAGPTRAGLALQAVGIPVYENQAVRLEKDGQAFWIAGLGDQWAFRSREGDDEIPPSKGFRYQGVDDLPRTLAQVTDDAPVILMAHEPDIFPEVPDRVSLTVSGHTHGGQVRIFGFAPMVPSRYGLRYVYGHKVEHGRNLIVSGGLGCSTLPVRLGSPPEIVRIDLGGNGGEV